jgi:GT2 family glycosyltransferase
VLVNYNGHLDTIECLESILKSNYTNYQIIVVDNTSEPSSMNEILLWVDGKKELIKTDFPEYVFPAEPKPVDYELVSEKDFLAFEKAPKRKLVLVRAAENHGFAGGNNLALRYFLKDGHFDFAWLLNNDTVIRPDTLRNYMTFMNNDQDAIGIAGGKLFKYYDRNRLQGVGGKYHKWFGLVRELGSGETDEGQWDGAKVHFDYVIGASMFTRKEFVLSVGLLEDEYFLYFEELDWAIRGARLGWKIAFCPTAVIFHKLGASTGSGKNVSELSDFFAIRNRILISRKFFPLTQLTLYPSFLLFFVNRIRMKKFDRIKLLFKVLLNPHQSYQKRITK